MSDIDPNGAGPVQEHLDTLTGLLNRVGVEACLASQERISPPPVLGALAVELSRFGYINDSVGSVLADRIIALVSRRLRKVFSHAALIGRTHGDHFCLVFARGENLDEQVGLLQDFVQRPLAVHGEIIVLSVRIGVAETGAEVASPSRLLHAAEVALHRAKRAGSKHCRYAAELEEEARETHKLENDLRVSLVTRSAELHQAISNDEFTLLYQPIIDLHSGGVHACEALIRWHHPLRGLIAPDEFIPMAEKIQVMDVLGNWIVVSDHLNCDIKSLELRQPTPGLGGAGYSNTAPGEPCKANQRPCKSETRTDNLAPCFPQKITVRKLACDTR